MSTDVKSKRSCILEIRKLLVTNRKSVAMCLSKDWPDRFIEFKWYAWDTRS